MAVAEGAYSVVMVTPDAIIAFRDPWGVRPLCIGTYGDNGYMIASESCALATVGAHYLREIEAGEIVIVDAQGIRTEHVEVVKPPALCMFEYIYFARPDPVLSGRSIYMARYQMGRALAREHPVDADVVMAVPDSAIPGGIGYAAESGLPYVEGLIKNRYIGRTFISPDQRLRSQGVQLKFNPIVENLRGQRVVVVDDSIVRGTTTPRIVSLLRDAGAREVHVRVTSPPIVHPCYLGVDMATYADLIAANNLHACQIYPFALGQRPTVVQLFQSSATDQAASVVEGFRPAEHYSSRQFATVFPGDDVLGAEHQEDISVIKIDVEGAERDVVTGLAATIDRHRPFIICEVLPVYDTSSGNGQFRLARQKDIQTFRREHHYRIHRVRSSDASLTAIEEFGVHADMSLCNYVFSPLERGL